MKGAKALVLSGILVVIMLAMGTSTLAAGMTGMGNNTPKSTDPSADRANFISLWQQASKAAAFTPEQSKQVQEILTAAAGKLAENFTALDALRQQKTGTAQQADLNKRIALKEAERDLLVDQAEQSLKSLLSEAQFGLLTMAAFHGVSQNHMESHQQNVHGGMNTTMDGLEQKAMDLGTLAGGLNINKKAVTLGIILDALMSSSKMNG